MDDSAEDSSDVAVATREVRALLEDTISQISRGSMALAKELPDPQRPRLFFPMESS
jgi:hypothetical protein